jgi:glyoxylase I family protein
LCRIGLQSFSHLGICVSDLERSTAFYVEVLRFRVLFTMEFGEELAATMERGGRFESRVLARDDVRIELLHWLDDPGGAGSEPGPPAAASRRPMDLPGITHLCFRVERPGELFEIAERCGGKAWPHTLSSIQQGPNRVEAVYLTDPDGVRIECLAGSPDLAGL